EWRSRMELVDAGDFPSPQQAMPPSQAAQKGNFINVVADEDVRAVEARRAVVVAVIVGVGEQLGEVGPVVGDVRVGISRAELQALAEPALHAYLKAVVVGNAGVLRNADDPHTKEWPQRVRIDIWIRLQRPRKQLVDVALALVVNA